eukprot:TRINITY_DN1835_c0_g1_i1.p1 TRINITY_DN1835_c0_g1~~TRINITY_DN1835_c0_g1_i1.p1  ORF type:complete len:518 (+),score=163.87 TRINITY_DN1835_c0_g1_i1:92-1645(+)
MTKDVEMKEASSSKKDAKQQDATTTAPPPPPTPAEANALLVADILKSISIVERSVATKEPRFVSRVLRQTTTLRKKMKHEVLVSVINQVYSSHPDSSSTKEKLLLFLGSGTNSSESMEVDSAASTTNNNNNKDASKNKPLLPEVEIYLHLLVLIYLIDHQRYQDAQPCADFLVGRVQNFNRATLNLLSARVYFFYSRTYELLNQLEQIRPALLQALRTATLRHNDEAQATLMNLLLRNYLSYNLFDQADKLVTKTTFPDQTISSNQQARYLYYQGRIKAIQLEYSEANTFLLQATRKAPQTGAIGFRQAVHKLACIVQLLMGEMPDRAIFNQKDLKVALKPYLQLAQAVRVGDLVAFHSVVDSHGPVFIADKTYTLIQRLRNNVIKTGLRKINIAYSRISLADVCKKLHLDAGVEDAEFIVAKAIHDGVIDASIDHSGQYMQSRETGDIYSTQEPHDAYHKRISFCLSVHNDAVQAMRFAPDAHKKSQEEVTKEALEREKQQQELAAELEEDDDDDF